MTRRVGKMVAVMVAAMVLSVTVLEIHAEARAGRRSGGGSGSQNYTKPVSPAPQPSPSRQQVAPPPGPAQPQAAGGFMRSMAGGIMGGLLGGMLFSSFAGADDGLGGLGGSGVGLFEILLLAGGGYFLYRVMARRRACTATASGASGPQQGTLFPMAGALRSMEPQQTEVEVGLSHIRRMDSAFDVERFNDAAMDSFFKIQAAWMQRALGPAANLLTEEMRSILQGDLDQLLRDGQINRLENIAVRKVEILEARQELGRDYISASIYANLLDYTIDERSGAVVSGSTTDPVKFQEFWIFTRAIGAPSWQLSAIRQP